MATQSKPSSVQVVAKDFRKTASAVKLAKLAFDPDKISKLNPAIIMRLLQDAGLKIPPDVRIGVDAAQILLAGGAFVSNINKAAEIKSFMAPSTAAMQAALDIMTVTGLVHREDPAVQMIQFGTDLAMVISSSGVNVLADIALAVDVVKQAFQAFSGVPDNTEAYHNYAKSMASKGLRDMFITREKLQSYKAANDFKSYQSGDISVFEMLGHVAEDAPDLFYNYFPQFKGFMPPATMTLIYNYHFERTDKGGLFGLSSRSYDFTETVSYTFETIFNERSAVQAGLVDYFLLTPAKAYFDSINNFLPKLQQFGFPKEAEAIGVKSHGRPIPRILIQDLAILSMMPPYFDFIGSAFDIRPYLLSAGLTPHDLGYDVIENELRAGDFANPTRKESAITMNGVDYFSNQDKAYNDAVAKIYDVNAITKYDYSGAIGSLLKNSLASKIIAEWGLMPTYNGTEMDWSKSTDYYGKQGYRSIRNFWSLLQLTKMMSDDKYFKGYEIKDKIYSYFGSPEELDEKFRRIQWISTGKKLNELARQNLAKLLDIPVNKLQFNPIKQGEPVTLKL